MAKKVVGQLSNQQAANLSLLVALPWVSAALTSWTGNPTPRPKRCRSVPRFGRDHLLPGQILHLRDEDAPGVLQAGCGSRRSKRNRTKGSEKPGRATAGSVTTKQVREIAQTKMQDLSANSVEEAMKIIAGSARSIGIEVKG